MNEPVKIAKCKCGGLRRPGDVSQSFALVKCCRCNLWIQPKDQARIQYYLDNSLLVSYDITKEGVSVKITDARETISALGSGPSLAEAFNGLKWAEGATFSPSLVSAQVLNESAAWDATSPAADELAPCLGCQSTDQVARNVLEASRNLPPAPWSVSVYGSGAMAVTLEDRNAAPVLASLVQNAQQGQKNLQGLAFIRDAAPLLASRASRAFHLVQECVDALENIRIAGNLDMTRKTAEIILAKASGQGIKPGGQQISEGAPHCPLCGAFMKACIVEKPDPKSNVSGNMPRRLVPMVQYNAWACNCSVR